MVRATRSTRLIAARRQPHALRRLGQQLDARRFRRGDAVQQFAFGFGIGADLRGLETRALDVAGAATRAATSALPSAGGGRARSLAEHARHFDMQVDAVEQRPGNARLVIGAAFGRARTGLRRIAEITAAAGVHRRHQLKARRIAHMGVGARHHRFAGLDRLAQTVQHAALEFRQLVQEQHAQMRQRDFARLHFQPAADQRRHRGGMMRIAERPLAADGAVGQFARQRTHHGNLQRLARIQRRQQAGQALRQHRLARAGRADHQKIMSARRRDLQARAWRFPGPSRLSGRARRASRWPAWAPAASAPTRPSCD